MTPTPTELNQTSDDSLFAIVDASALLVVASANQAAPLAPYFTLELLRRVHERVVALKQAGQTTAAKHLLLGRAILSLIGMPIPPDDRDVDKIGNHLDVWLKRRYIDVDKLVKNVKNIDVKKEKRLALQAQCCTITSWGGVAESAVRCQCLISRYKDQMMATKLRTHACLMYPIRRLPLQWRYLRSSSSLK